MKVLVLTNNEVSKPLIERLARQETVVVHHAALPRDKLHAIAPDLVVSYCYRHILEAEIIQYMPERFINLHISLLPYNRGADPNVWSFLDDTPKGVTVHLIDAGIDTGPTLLQEAMSFDEAHETLAGSYWTLHEAIQDLFFRNWDAVLGNLIVPKAQSVMGTYHRSADFAGMKDRLLGAEGWQVTIKRLRDRYRELFAQPQPLHGKSTLR